MRNCELCKNVARMYCESDDASLCLECDEMVHCANFLVAKHSRSLLCQVCQSPTPWNASGAKLCPTVSVCVRCVDKHEKREERGEEESRGASEDEDEIDEYYDDDNDDDDEDEYDEEEEDEVCAENQVVPWSCTLMPPPLASSSSTEGESTSMRLCSFGFGSELKRNRQDSDLDSDDENGFEASTVNSLRLLKQHRTDRLLNQVVKGDDNSAAEDSTAVISSIKALQKRAISDENDASTAINGIRKLRRDHSC